jgi:sugar phosphate isomerase/epimerase
MDIKFFCPKWGSEILSWDIFCARVKAAGYDGVETPVSFDAREHQDLKAALQAHGLLLIGQYYQSFEKDLQEHKVSFERHMQNLCALNPLLIDAQTGKDYFTPGQNKEIFEVAAKITKETGVPIAHETHRNKALFAAHVTRQLLEQNPDIMITADFSHWCNVSESLLEQQEEALRSAITRSVHIHARVGHAESAQVSDPRAPEWADELAAHLEWWDAIIDHRVKSGAKLTTITPEFGPAPYMPALPYTRMPVAHQWEINLYMMNLLKARYRHVAK